MSEPTISNFIQLFQVFKHRLNNCTPQSNHIIDESTLKKPICDLIKDIMNGPSIMSSSELIQISQINPEPSREIEINNKFNVVNPKIAWSESNDKILEVIAIQYCRDWKKIQRRIKNLCGIVADINFLKFRFSFLIKNKKNKKCHFSSTEDRILLKVYDDVGTNWQKISEALPNRCPLMIKNRYYYLARKTGFKSSF